MDTLAHLIEWPRETECLPPCWVHITPGETQLDEAAMILQANPDVWSVREYPGLGDETGAIEWEGAGIIGTALATNRADETITYITVQLENHIAFQAVREVYGDPTHVQFWYDEERAEYTFSFIYANHGFSLDFVSLAANGLDQALDDTEGDVLSFFAPRSLEGYMSVQNIDARLSNIVDWRAGQSLKYYCEQAYGGDAWMLEYCPE